MLVSNRAQAPTVRKGSAAGAEASEGTARHTRRRHLIAKLLASLAVLSGLLLAPQLTPAAQADTVCLATGMSPEHAAPISFTVTCPDGVTYYYGYNHTAYYYRATCYTFDVFPEGMPELGWVTLCKPA
jgi:hypothetical protein